MANQIRGEDWKILVNKYEASGESLTSFCKSHALATSTFRYHIEKHSKNPFSPKRKKKFYPLIPMSEVNQKSISEKEISLDLPYGIKLTIKG
jgi:hypothetical protein